jgi:hypothetical protein
MGKRVLERWALDNVNHRYDTDFERTYDQLVEASSELDF